MYSHGNVWQIDLCSEFQARGRWRREVISFQETYERVVSAAREFTRVVPNLYVNGGEWEIPYTHVCVCECVT